MQVGATESEGPLLFRRPPPSVESGKDISRWYRNLDVIGGRGVDSVIALELHSQSGVGGAAGCPKAGIKKPCTMYHVEVGVCVRSGGEVRAFNSRAAAGSAKFTPQMRSGRKHGPSTVRAYLRRLVMTASCAISRTPISRPQSRLATLLRMPRLSYPCSGCQGRSACRLLLLVFSS